MSTSTSLASTSDQSNDVSQQQGPSISNSQQPLPNAIHNPPPPPAGPPPPLNNAPSFCRRAPPLNLPCGDLLVERETYINVCVPLFEASINGDWVAANRILENRQEQLVGYSITENHDTVLHIAASAQQSKFVTDLVLSVPDIGHLELQNSSGDTAFCLAAASGDIEITKTIMERNRRVLTIPGRKGMMPLYMAALNGQHETVDFLYDNSDRMTGDFWTPQNRGLTLLKCVESDFFDIALKILNDHKELAKSGRVLGVLARKPYALDEEGKAMELLKLVWKSIMTMPKAEIGAILKGPYDKLNDGRLKLDMNGTPTHSSQILFVAAELGNDKFVWELIYQYPDLIWKLNDNNQSIFHVAVSHRKETIYDILYLIGSMKDMITPLTDPQGNNMLHLVGKDAKENRLQDMVGVAFQMHLELLWFKEVESMIPPTYRERKNNDGLTPRELFDKNHKDLVSKSEEWMKSTANQCMVVAALIATIVFGVAFTIPGGYNQNTGFTMFRRKEIFIAFIISDAISLIFASASILMFLSILTSRYSQREFLESLPRKLMIGLATLFLSIMTMMVTFSISFYVLYYDKLIWVPIVISVVAVVPVILYAKLQYPILVDTYRSLYVSRFMDKQQKKLLLYNRTQSSNCYHCV